MSTSYVVRACAALALAGCALPSLAAAPATLPDTLEQRVAACTACHAVKERGDAFFPRIAGKPAGYLYNQLVNFREGRRHYPMMTYMVDHLPDAYLREIADYYAQQHPPYPPAQAGSGASASEAALARGQALVRHGDPARKIPACVACHGNALTGVAPAIPGLIGLPSDYVNAQFGAWKNKVRRAAAPDCMAEIANRLSETDIAAVSGWLSKQTPDAAARPGAADSIAMPLPLSCGSVPAP
ncbi:c-type cytochrome [Duganella violaceipulchra]|uniref:C-type cytochrome n=1 Tax=Duganella violaceipulchra TaxID=2849652 RepID=A0AA41H9H5_9BURK|nr:c-type cytochrome [Duganella violaceicalia]MBV6323190.1 c-type cytochrome [Duganella violaceicalia]MCP2010022.1 cytochrome c553 [Duganella violaceicalia]